MTKELLEYFNNDKLAADVWYNKYRCEGEVTPKDMFKRLASEINRIENKYPNPLNYDKIYNLFDKFNYIILGGSNLFGIGNNKSLSSLGNCFVISNPNDSYGSILKTDEEQVQIMKRRGGVGHDISHLRPKGTIVSNAAKTSTGAVSFMHRYSNSTNEVAQEGRRGALMLTMNVTHPDIMDFIKSKDDLTKITGANISVKVTDEFMNELFKEKPEVVEIWNSIIHQAWKSAEPGVLFWDTIIKESPADCYADYGFKTISTNPCGELPLCPYDSCRLLSINLMGVVRNPFTKGAYLDYDTLHKVAVDAQRIADDIVDLEEEKIDAIINKIENDKENDSNSVELELWHKIKNKLLQGRRTGVGITSLGDTFAALGVRYASDESIQIAEKIMKTIAVGSYTSSIKLARERGCFPIWKLDSERKNPFIQRILIEIGIPSETYSDYVKWGRRNIANLTIAPNGTLAILAQSTSGVEPVFALSYQRRRKTETGSESYIVYHPGFERWMKYWENEIANCRGDGSNATPYDKSTAHEIDPVQKVKMIGAMQKWIDHSISNTTNLHKDITEEEVSSIYKKAWESGCKGVTIYRDGSRDGVLTISEQDHFKQYHAPKRPKTLDCDLHSTKIKGNTYNVFVGILENKPYEVFAINGGNEITKGDSGKLTKVKSGEYVYNDSKNKDLKITENLSDEQAAITRLTSTALRHGAEIKFIVEQLNKTEGDLTSFSKAMARTLKKYIKDWDAIQTNSNCPECNNVLTFEGGCYICKECGYSKC